MNKKFLLSFFVMAAILTLSSCSNKLKPLAEEYIKAEPQPLEAIGGQSTRDYQRDFPCKMVQQESRCNCKLRFSAMPVVKHGEHLTLIKVKK